MCFPHPSRLSSTCSTKTSSSARGYTFLPKQQQPDFYWGFCSDWLYALYFKLVCSLSISFFFKLLESVSSGYGSSFTPVVRRSFGFSSSTTWFNFWFFALVAYPNLCSVPKLDLTSACSPILVMPPTDWLKLLITSSCASGCLCFGFFREDFDGYESTSAFSSFFRSGESSPPCLSGLGSSFLFIFNY